MSLKKHVAVSPPSPSEIKAAVEREDDFGHEMRVGHIIRCVSEMESEHGGTYTDPVTLKPRQFDYRCSLTKGAARLSLAVECKNLSASVPLVVCGAVRRDNEAFHDLIESRQGSFVRHSARLVGLSSVTRRASGENTIYLPGRFVGKSLLRIQTDKTPMVRTPDSDVYDKWAQALSSAVGLVEMACTLPKGASSARFFTAVLPIVVVPDERLWATAYDGSGRIMSDPKLVNECELFVGREIDVGGPKKTALYHQVTFSHVHFFTLTGFGSFLSKMAVNDHAWASLFAEMSVEL